MKRTSRLAEACAYASPLLGFLLAYPWIAGGGSSGPRVSGPADRSTVGASPGRGTPGSREATGRGQPIRTTWAESSSPRRRGFESGERRAAPSARPDA